MLYFLAYCSQQTCVKEYGNVIVSRTTDLTQSSNKTDVINIKNPNQNGVSHNQFDEFSVQDGVIFNNSLKDGNSQIGG